MTEGPPEIETTDDGIPLMEGWMLGQLMFPYAMQEVVRVPPANDPVQ